MRRALMLALPVCDMFVLLHEYLNNIATTSYSRITGADRNIDAMPSIRLFVEL